MMSLNHQKPVAFAVTRHPWLPDRWTHLVKRADARKAGWLTTGNLPLGSWASRSGADQHARRLTATGRFILSKGARL